jgi:hypothetical protein
MAQSQVLYSSHSQGCNINKYCITNYLSKPSISRLVPNRGSRRNTGRGQRTKEPQGQACGSEPWQKVPAE